MEDAHVNGHEQQRPLGMTLLAGLYLFFFLLTVSAYGQPYPLLGGLQQGHNAELLVFADSLACLYLFLGIIKCQRLTWYLLLAYNLFELLNTVLNLVYITPAQLKAALGEAVDPQTLVTGNLLVMAVIVLLSVLIMCQRSSFSNRSAYLFFN